MSRQFEGSGRAWPALPSGPTNGASPGSGQYRSQHGQQSQQWSQPDWIDTRALDDKPLDDRRASPSPFDVFVDRAVGGLPRSSAVAHLHNAVASARSRIRLVMVVAVVGLIGAVLWWVISAMGTNGSAMDPDLPFAATGATEAPAGGVGGSDGTDVVPTSVGAESSTVLVVHVAGAVMNPGVHTVASGGRVHDAVAAAGGPRADADLHRLNLAGPVADGARVYVPAVGETTPPPVIDGTIGPPASQTGAPSGSAGGSGQQLSLSTATSLELQELPGVGPSTAEAIIAHREANGPFATVDGLLDVRGIGPAKLSALRDLVVP